MRKRTATSDEDECRLAMFMKGPGVMIFNFRRVHAIAVTLLMAATGVNATAFEPLALTIATSRGNDFNTPPWKVLATVPSVKWASPPAKAGRRVEGVLMAENPADGIPKRLILKVDGSPAGFHRVEILGTIKHGTVGAGSASASFSPHLFGQASVRRIFTTCDDDGVANMIAHYAVEYDGHKPIYVSFDASIGNAASTMLWRLHLTEAAMLSATSPTCEREKI